MKQKLLSVKYLRFNHFDSTFVVTTQLNRLQMLSRKFQDGIGNIEFVFNSNLQPEGFAHVSGHFFPVSLMDDNRINILFLSITEQYPLMMRWFLKHRLNDRREAVYQFCRCNLAVLDEIPDVDENGKIHPENIPCQFKGTDKCKFNQELCLINDKKQSFPYKA